MESREYFEKIMQDYNQNRNGSNPPYERKVISI